MDLGFEAELIAKVTLAMLLGAVLGFEREISKKPAGLRTHMFIAGAAALLVGLADALVDSIDVSDGLVRTDPLRVIEAVITGVSFIGAGTIIFRGDAKDRVQGLTTAALMLMSAGIGLAVAVDLFAVAVAVSMLSLVVLRFVKQLEDSFRSRL